MIEEFEINDNYTFNKSSITKLNNGLIVFTGPSGSGKSVFMKSMLGLFAIDESTSKSSHSIVNYNLNLEDYGIDHEDGENIIFKQSKKDKVRYFINNQPVSKKTIKEISNKFIRHLSLKDYSDFEDHNLINLLDTTISKKIKNYSKILLDHQEKYKKYRKIYLELNQIIEKESKITELKEFTEFEINKIKEINPKLDEDIELMEIKKKISRKDKIVETMDSLNMFMELEGNVFSFLNTIDSESDFFSSAMEELKDKISETESSLEELSDMDIESLLDRIEQISDLKNKYGSIKECLEELDKKEEELISYNNISFEKSELEKNLEKSLKELKDKENEISKIRKENIKLFSGELTKYTNDLYLENVNVILTDIERTNQGINKLNIDLNNVELKKISTGEFNRLRLAVLAIKSNFMQNDGGILMLDEIDANLSGEESMSVAKVLLVLSKKFQIFAISHQPQLTSCAHKHFLINKENGISDIKELNKEEKIKEISRMISGDKITKEAINFAKHLLD